VQLRTPWATPWRFELTSARGRSFRDPDQETVRRVLAQVSPEYYFAVLSRRDDWYIQVGFGEAAGARSGWYALERRDGTPDQHFRAELSNVDDVLGAFLGFLHEDPRLASRFPWRPYTAAAGEEVAVTVDEVTRFDWLMDTDIGESGACITVVPGANLHAVIWAFGGDPAQATEGQLDRASLDAPTALLRRVGDWVLVVESNGFQGSREEVLRRLTGRIVSVYWNVNALTRFSYAVGGRVLAAFDAMAWDRLSDDELDAMQGQVAGLPWDDADPESVMLALAARLTGLVLRPEHLAGPMTFVPLVPWQRDLADQLAPSELSGRLDRAASRALEHADERHQRAAARVAVHVAAEAAGLRDHPALRAVVDGRAGVAEHAALDQ
jgi:hypothetical protein